MTSAIQPRVTADHTDLKHLLRHAAMLGGVQAAAVLLFSLASRALEGTPELAVRAVIVLGGLAATTLLPGIWTRPRTIEGIAGAAGIGLGATAVFLLLDVSLLQPLGTYTNRWREIGGGSNWWYHPVWWMAGTFLAWMGAFAQANQAARGGANPAGVFLLALVLAAVGGALGVVFGVPFAGWTLGTFAVAFLPGIALTALVTGLGGRRA